MYHLLCGKSAVLPADLVKMSRTDPQLLRIIYDAVLVAEFHLQQRTESEEIRMNVGIALHLVGN